ncbi:MAG: hypothetical protein Q8K99_01290 [Actinomycetota bacterium]|nr:hypothetical protein [Actinomycetota bacterium]
MSKKSGAAASPVGAYIALVIFAIVVSVDSYQIVKTDRKVDGLLGTHPLIWGACVLLLAIVGIPLYFYQRPRIIVAYS